MILRIFLLACTVFVTPSFGMMTTNEFTEKFEDMCFQNEDTDPFRVNGQENPLSNTLENFIAMAEKFEAANPTVDLKGELFYFIRNYMFENIRLTTNGVGQWQTEETTLEDIQKTLDDDTNTNGQLNSINDIFTDEEKCSLYFMISHSIVEKRKEPTQYKAYDFNNSSSNRVFNNDLNPDDYYPQEIGVVAIRGSHMAVSLSKVLVGMYVGLKNSRERELSSFQLKDGLPNDLLPEDRIVDLLYTHTLADVLVLAQWLQSTRKGYAPNGEWASIPLGNNRIDGFCPMVYRQSTAQIAYSYSSVRGAADGLILGNIIKPLYEKKRDARLSEILRMYYSRDGIAVEKKTEEISASSVSFCNRREVLTNFERKLDNQMLLYGFLIGKKSREVPNIIATVKNEYLKEQDRIYDMEDAKLGEYCVTPPTLDRTEDLPKETFLDIFVVMDSRTSQELFEQQQLIIGYLSKYMDLRYSGSRMTILVDQRINSGTGSSGKVELKPVVIDTYSSSCAACTVGQISYQRSETERDQIIVAIDQLLSERKENETKQHGANGKVVVYFDYQNDAPQVGSNNRIQGRLEKALRDLHLRHLDTLLYAVGLDSDVLKKFARNDPSLLFLASDGTEEMVAEKLYLKIASAPGLLQYADCEDGRNEPSAIYENFVSPMSIQHWVMPAKYFYKSRNLKVTFESTNAIIRVCHSRATTKPENELKNCMNTTVANRMEFKLSNPCQSFTRDTCSPFYFSVIGIRNSKELSTDNGRPRDYCNDINDQWCNTLDSIKFKVSHDGVRCNGCLGLGALPSVLIFALLLTYFLHKKL